MTRAERRYRWEIAKKRAARVWTRWNKPSPLHGIPYKSWSSKPTLTGGGYTFYSARDYARGVAHLAETHCKPCSCMGCAHHKSVPPRRERGFQEVSRGHLLDGQETGFSLQ